MKQKYIYYMLLLLVKILDEIRFSLKIDQTSEFDIRFHWTHLGLGG